MRTSKLIVKLKGKRKDQNTTAQRIGRAIQMHEGKAMLKCTRKIKNKG